MCFLALVCVATAKSVAAGEGLVSARPDKESTFEIIAHNRKGHRQRTGGDTFEVRYPVTWCPRTLGI